MTHVREKRQAASSRVNLAPTYIIKPSGGSEGIGIFLLQHERLIPRYKVATIPLVAQDYISPMLLDGKKFDLRLYVLIRSVDPLEVYLHCEGLQDSAPRITLLPQRKTWDAPSLTSPTIR